MGRRNIYALVVAIDNYSNGIRPLDGCLNDQRGFIDYLKRYVEDDNVKVHVMTLRNSEATRNAIVKGFRHFNEASDGDICLFQFCGHGSLVPTTDFWESFNGYNQTILCADSTTDNSLNDLVDKELSWLIYQAVGAKKLHFLTIMDCCHSGGNTRANALASIRFVTRAPAFRPLKSYLGYADLIPDGHGRWSAPKAKHIALSACHPDQSAAEISIEGVIQGAFTASLLKVLRSSNYSKTYIGLESSINQQLCAYGIGQQIHAEGIAGANIGDRFIDAAIAERNRYWIAWDPTKLRLELNAGYISGIGRGTKLIGLSKEITGKIFQVDEVQLDRSTVSGTGCKDNEDPMEVLPVADKVRSVAIAVMLLKNASHAKMLIDAFHKEAQPFAKLVKKTSDAEFCVTEVAEGFAFCRKGFDKPLFAPVKYKVDIDSSEFWDKVWAVLKWQYLLQLENPVTNIYYDDFQVKLYASQQNDWWDFDGYAELKYDQRDHTFAWAERDGRYCAPGLGMKITNNDPKPLYFSALYMSGRFGIENAYLPMQRLDTGEHAWLTWTDEDGVTHKGIGLTIEDLHWEAGLTTVQDYIKIFVADREFSTNRLNQPALDLIPLPAHRGNKAFKRPRSNSAIQLLLEKKDWTTRCFPIKIAKPRPNI